MSKFYRGILSAAVVASAVMNFSTRAEADVTAVPQSAVPAAVRATYGSSFVVSSGIVTTRNTRSLHCARAGVQFGTLTAWFHTTEVVSDADRANGIQSVDVFTANAKIYRPNSSVPWQNVNNDPDVGTLGTSQDGTPYFAAQYARTNHGFKVTNVMQCFSL